MESRVLLVPDESDDDTPPVKLGKPHWRMLKTVGVVLSFSATVSSCIFVMLFMSSMN